MAFYSARVDQDGKEIERRLTARSLASVPELTSRTSSNLLSERSTHSTGRKYINSAVYIEKTSDDDDGCSIKDDNIIYQNTSDDGSNIVPPLDLTSEYSYMTTTRENSSYLYPSQTEAAKLVLKPDVAYSTWLSAKKKEKEEEALRRKKVEEKKRQEQEERRRQSDEKFKEWVELKSRQGTRSREQLKTIKEQEQKERPKSKTQLSDKASQEKLQKWEQAKKVEIARRRMLKEEEEKRRVELEEQRREMANEAWEKWIIDVKNKPKPVPLSRGVSTLRGTISDIYINPNEWVNIVPTDDD